MADLLGNRPSGPRALRELLASGQTIVAPGAFDALSARLVEQAGFPAVYMTGFGTAASLLGRPDVGLLGLAEMADDARRIVGAVAIPVIADADAGYGNAVNVVRTVQEDERAGVAALHLEDQTSPKRCGHLDDKTVVSTKEMVGKISAAVAARQNPDLVIIARTDARTRRLDLLQQARRSGVGRPRSHRPRARSSTRRADNGAATGRLRH